MTRQIMGKRNLEHYGIQQIKSGKRPHVQLTAKQIEYIKAMPKEKQDRMLHSLIKSIFWRIGKDKDIHAIVSSMTLGECSLATALLNWPRYNNDITFSDALVMFLLLAWERKPKPQAAYPPAPYTDPSGTL